MVPDLSLFSPFSVWTCMMSAGIITLMAASLFLILDLRKMQREYRQGIWSVWYRRPWVRLWLSVIGIALIVLLAALLFSLDTFPFLIGSLGLGCIVLGIDGSRLVFDLRTVQQECREGFPLAWYRRPKTLKLMARITFSLGLFWQVGYAVYALAQGFPSAFRLNIYLMILIPSLFEIVAAALFLYAVFLQIRRRFLY